MGVIQNGRSGQPICGRATTLVSQLGARSDQSGNFNSRSIAWKRLFAQGVQERLGLQPHQAWITQPQRRLEPFEREEVRAATCNSLISASELSSSSVSPSEKYSCSLSPLRFAKGSTAIECGGGLNAAVAAGTAGAPG